MWSNNIIFAFFTLAESTYEGINLNAQTAISTQRCRLDASSTSRVQLRLLLSTDHICLYEACKFSWAALTSQQIEKMNVKAWSQLGSILFNLEDRFVSLGNVIKRAKIRQAAKSRRE